MSLITKLMSILPHRDIVKNGDLYLRRHYLTPKSWPWRVFIHLINRPDNDRDPHSHPWRWLGCVISPGKQYTEKVFNQNVLVATQKRRSWRPAFRSADFTHQITCLDDGPIWTIVIAAQAQKVWGFWTSEGFVPAANYLKREDVATELAFPEDEIPGWVTSVNKTFQRQNGT